MLVVGVDADGAGDEEQERFITTSSDCMSVQLGQRVDCHQACRPYPYTADGYNPLEA